jgi:acyl carrier protein
MNDMNNKITQIISSILLVEPSELTDTMARNEYETWDSMTHLTIVSQLELEFNIFFTDDEVVNMVTVADIRKTISSKLA